MLDLSLSSSSPLRRLPLCGMLDMERQGLRRALVSQFHANYTDNYESSCEDVKCFLGLFCMIVPCPNMAN